MAMTDAFAARYPAAFRAASCPRTWLISVMPVALPPGLLTLATRPAPTGSKPTTKTIGMVAVAALAARAAGGACPRMSEDRIADEFASHGRKSRILAIRPAVFDRYIPTFVKACLAQAAQKRCELRLDLRLG